MITPGVWGYRTAAERREWLKDHALPTIDYTDVHNYPRDDHDTCRTFAASARRIHRQSSRGVGDR